MQFQRKVLTVKLSVRRVLADSHVGVATVAMLLLFAFHLAFNGLWPPLLNALKFLGTAIAILDVPYVSPVNAIDRLNLIRAAFYLYSAVVAVLTAWLISRWVYGVGPLRCLAGYRSLIGKRR